MTIKVPIGSSLYHVEIDGSNYALSKDSGKVNIKTNEMPQTQMGYFTCMDNAVKKIVDDQLAANDAVVDLKEFLAEYKKIELEIKSLLA